MVLVVDEVDNVKVSGRMMWLAWISRRDVWKVLVVLVEVWMKWL